MALDVRYAASRDGHIAYETFGGGDLELVVALGPMSHLEVMREHPEAARFLERLGTFARVAVFDRRGMGLSDPVSGPVTLEEQVEDLGAVIDADHYVPIRSLPPATRTAMVALATIPGQNDPGRARIGPKSSLHTRRACNTTDPAEQHPDPATVPPTTPTRPHAPRANRTLIGFSHRFADRLTAHARSE
jgi:hypothetical protein